MKFFRKINGILVKDSKTGYDVKNKAQIDFSTGVTFHVPDDGLFFISCNSSDSTVGIGVSVTDSNYENLVHLANVTSNNGVIGAQSFHVFKDQIINLEYLSDNDSVRESYFVPYSYK